MDLKEKLAALRAKIKELATKADITKEEATELESLLEQAEAIKTQLKAAGEVDEGDKELSAEQAAELEKVKKEAADTAVAEAEKKWKADAAKGNRLPGGGEEFNVPYASQFAELSKYDNLDAVDQSLLIGILSSVGPASAAHASPISENAYKALAIKLAEDKTEIGHRGRSAMKAVGIKSLKSDELMQSTLNNYGDEWVGVAYSTSLWEKIRTGTFVAQRIPSFEMPPGMESINFPINETDPTFYKVAQAIDHNATLLFPNATVTSSQQETEVVTLTLGKMGARVPYSGEMVEDSLIPFVGEIKSVLVAAGADQLEHLLIDGDTDASATTNINDKGGTPTSTDLFLLLNGFRKSCLITTAANSRSGGVLGVSDYLETIKLMGSAGINAIDITKVSFIIDPSTHWKSLELAEVLTRDVFAQPTIENGKLTGVFGYKIDVSANMHFQSAVRKANTAGMVDQTTTANNTTGSILAVRWDQWKLGWRRRMTMEVTRYPRSDSWEIVALMRLGMIQRDTEASAITYNLTV